MGGLRARTDQAGGVGETEWYADIAAEAEYRLGALAQGLTELSLGCGATSGSNAVEDLVGHARTIRDVCMIGGFDAAAATAADLAGRVGDLADSPPPTGPELVAALLSAVETFELIRGIRTGGSGRRPTAEPPQAEPTIGPPQAETTIGPPQADPTSEPGPVRPRVLVVDGVVGLRERERETLERAGYAVRTAADGPDALAALRCWTADLVVADAELPGMSGIELTAAIRRTLDLGPIPVIVLVTHVTDEVRRQSARAGAAGLVLKSAFAERELLGAVARVLSGQR